MANSPYGRPLKEEEYLESWKVPIEDLILINYDNHPRYHRGTILHKNNGNTYLVTGDRWRPGVGEKLPEPMVIGELPEVNVQPGIVQEEKFDPEFEKFKDEFRPLISDKDGFASHDKALNELYDYWRRSELLDKIIEEYSGGRMSSGRIYHFSSVKEVFDEQINDLVSSTVNEALEAALNDGVGEAIKNFGSAKLKASQDVKFG